MSKPQRELELQAWLRAKSTLTEPKIKILAGDASFRRYYRVSSPTSDMTEVLVDAPPPESLEPFHSVALAYANAGLSVPTVIAVEEELGVMLLEDLGDTLLLQTDCAAYDRYIQAIDLLPQIMSVQSTRLGPIPNYDSALLERENNLFVDWLLNKHLGIELTPDERVMWANFTRVMNDNALRQPQVGVHRDYHSRNIMVRSDDSLALIDFQDAVRGPITYDLVSLLRDCYVQWPNDFVEGLLGYAYDLFIEQKLLAESVSFIHFRRWFDLMGLQRHTKASGIFARLYHRDGKAGYLNDIPQTVSYIAQVAVYYDELREYGRWVEKRILSAL
ncbi:aminoglycoside phosphotransferase family protein [Aliidiomarina quisquiliarum]|uniref:aminoglycoside phosphotransferase family protein n=1 Tax=Aliidiomarina quisquiliarum TaxID=2938947 RepID=UPI00208F60E2|nr:phosphotransferase [Aliidiomarina quisquiliarum]